MTKCLRFLKSTFGNSEGDVVAIEREDDTAFYFTDDFDRWCYLERDSPSIEVLANAVSDRVRFAEHVCHWCQ